MTGVYKMEFIWGRYSGLFYTGAGVIFFIGVGLVYGHFWFSLAAVFFILFVVGISDYSQKKRAVLGLSLIHISEPTRPY